jgi:hypothetical protein
VINRESKQSRGKERENTFSSWFGGLKGVRFVGEKRENLREYNICCAIPFS